MYLLDTNMLSEIIKKNPNKNFIKKNWEPSHPRPFSQQRYASWNCGMAR